MGGSGTLKGIPDEPQWSSPVKILRGHGHNIPSISFLNDASGNWLVGTSIDGRVIVWDIEREEKAQATNIGDDERGWSVLFLQLECFLPTRNEYEGLGGPEIMKLGKVYDVSPFSVRPDSDWGTGSEDGDSGDDGTETEDYDDDDDDLEGPADSGYYWAATRVGSSLDQSMDEAGDDDDESWDDNNSLWEASQVLADSDTENRTGSDGAAIRALLVETAGSDFRPDRPDHVLPLTVQNTEFQPQLPPPPRTIPQSFILSTSEYNVRLLDATTLEENVICQHVLHIRPPSGMSHYLGNIDRLNMVGVIPELSMALVASQKGTVAIFRLTQNHAGYMMRLEDILPREPNNGVSGGPLSHDEPRARPCAALLGIAVGPIQGREFGRSRSNSYSNNAVGSGDDEADHQWLDPDEAWARKKRGVWRGLERRRRYRLMMVYIDGSILSYELGGTSENELSACMVDGGYLMV